MQKQAKRLFWNALLLSAASLFIRTVGVSFQVLLAGRIGAEAMGLYTLMGGVYGFALTLATSGIQLGVTRRVTENVGEGHTERVLPTLRRATLYAAGFGLLAALLLLGTAKPIGLLWLKDARTVRPLRIFALTLPLIALSSVWNGYFSAVRRAYKSAAAQVSEQICRVAATLLLLSLLSPSDVESACCLLVLGGALAELLSFLLQFLLYLPDRRKHFARADQEVGGQEGRRLIGITLPIALAAYIRSALLTLEHILIPEGLRNSGHSHKDALTAYGSIQSMALPVILYPAALISAFSGLLIPEMAESRVRGGERRISYMIGRVWSLSLLFSIGVAGILLSFSGTIGEALYPGTQTAHYLRILAPLIPIMYVDTATDAILKGLGEQVYCMKVNIADALLSVVLVTLLIPRLGILGYVVTIYVSELLNTVLSVHRLLCIRPLQVKLFKWVYKPLFSIVGATAAARLLLSRIGRLPQSPFAVISLCSALTLALYLLLLLLTGGLEREDLRWLLSLCSPRRREPSEKEPAELPALKRRRKRGLKESDIGHE